MTRRKNLLFLTFYLASMVAGAAAGGLEKEVNREIWTSPVISVHAGDWRQSVDVRSVFVGDLGFIWTGGTDGLRKFTGGEPKAIVMPGKNHEEDPVEVVDISQRDGESKVWFLTPSGLGWIEQEEVHARLVCQLDADEKGVSFTSFAFGVNGTLWITSTTGLYRFDEEGACFIPVYDGELPELTQVIADQNDADTLWLCAGLNGLIQLDLKTGKSVRHFHEIRAIEEVAGTAVTSICQMPDGDVLIGGKGILSRLHVRTGSVTTQSLKVGWKVRHLEISAMVVDPFDSGVWIGTKKSFGLMHLDLRENEFSHFAKDIRFRTTRLGFNINDVAIDKSGVLWMATKEDGVARTAIPMVSIDEYSRQNRRGTMFYRAGVKSIKHNKRGVLAQTDLGIVQVDLAAQEVERLTGKARGETDQVFGMFMLPDGRLLSAFGNQIRQMTYDSNGEASWKRLVYLPQDEHIDRVVFAQELDSSGAVWLCWREKIMRLDLEAEELEVVGETLHWVDDVKIVGDDLWIVCQGQLSCMNIESRAIQRRSLSEVVNVSEIFPMEGEESDVLLATSQGLFTVGRDDLILERIELDICDVQSVCHGSGGSLWMIAEGELRLYDPSKNRFQVFAAEAELAARYQGLQTVASDGDGNLAIGGWAGVYHVSEKELLSGDLKERTSIFLKNCTYSGGPITETVSPCEVIRSGTLEIPPNTYGAKLQFGIPDYRYPWLIKFEYRLDQGSWLTAENGLVEIETLKFGEHTLSVRATDSIGVSAANEYKCSVIAIPPFTETPTFYVLVALGGFLTVLILQAWKHRSLSVAKDRLETLNRELGRSESKFRTIFETSSDAIVVTDSDSRILAANPAAVDLLGYDGCEESLDEVLLADYLKGARPTAEIIAEARQGQPILEESIEVIPDDENSKPISALLSLTSVKRGHGEEWQFQIRDVSRRIFLEEQIRQAQKMEAVGTLAGGIAHDFNNLLSPIIAHSSLAIDEIANSREKALPEASTALGICREAATKAAGLVAKLLHFARNNNDESGCVELVSATMTAIRLLKSSIPTSIEITTDFPDTSAWVDCSPQRLEQAIMNLGLNSAHAIGIQNGQIRVSIETTEGPDASAIDSSETWMLRIEDSGCGIDEETQRRVFEPFYTTKPFGEGSGLGLSMIHSFMEESDGAVEIDSTPGVGTTISLVFPRANQAEVSTENDTTSALEDSWTDRDRPVGGMILVVDDDTAVLLATTKILEKMGYEVDSFSDPVSALKAITKQPDAYSAVVSDQMMPEMTGLNLAENIRDVAPSVPVILLTGYSEVSLEEEGNRTQIAKVLLKPLDFVALDQALIAVIRASKTDSKIALAS